jgi:hypothetical protein
MKEETARAVANAIIGVVAIGAAVIILRTPRLRRLAFGLARAAIMTGIPAWLTREARDAWENSRTQNAERRSQNAEPGTNEARQTPTPEARTLKTQAAAQNTGFDVSPA